jgi:hypothetical protein
MKGREPMPHQIGLWDVALEVDPTTGLYWYDTVICTVQRQAAKTTSFGDVADHRCMTIPRARAWLTMQQGKDASSWMRNEWHEQVPPDWTAAGHVEKSLRAGSEGLYYPATGGRFQVFPPKRDAMHSKQSDLTGIDEAWAHDLEKGAELDQAIDPTQSTRPGAQRWILSTAGDDSSEYLAAAVASGIDSLADPHTRICFVDYGIPDDADPEDLDVVAAWHPAVGYTIDRSFIAAARRRFRKQVNGIWVDDVAGFARAYGNRPTRARIAAFDPVLWGRCGHPFRDRPARVGIAFDVTPRGDRGAVVAAWRDANNRPHLEVLKEEPGTDWMPKYVAEQCRTYRSPAGYDTGGVETLAVADKLARRHKSVEHHGTNLEEYAIACAELSRWVTAAQLVHFRQEPLDEAVQVAARRPVKDGGWVWGRSSSTGSIHPLAAGTVALRIFDTLPSVSRPRIVTARSA